MVNGVKTSVPAPSRKSLKTTVELIQYIADNEEELVAFVEKVADFSEDGELSKEELTELADLVMEEMNIELEPADVKLLVSILRKGDLTAVANFFNER